MDNTNLTQNKLPTNTPPTHTSGIKALLVLMLVIVIAGAGISSATLALFLTQNEAAAEEEGTKENDVTISEIYVIRSTEHISDAYKSGDTSLLSDKDRETLDLASSAISEFIKDGMSDYEKEKAAYDWIAKNLAQDQGLLTVIPSSGEDSDNPYGALKYHNAVCVGYATTFRLFMQMLDIPCMVVHESSLYHSWNLVQIDGDWYHVDCYLGSSSGNYQYFNMTDSMCSQTWDRSFFPAATSVKYNISYTEAEKCNDIFEIPAKMREAIESHKNLVSLKFPKNLTESNAKLANDMLSKIESLLWSMEGQDNTYLIYTWYPLEDCNLYVINIFDQDSNSDIQSLTEDDERKSSEAVYEAFSDIADAEHLIEGYQNNEELEEI